MKNLRNVKRLFALGMISTAILFIGCSKEEVVHEKNPVLVDGSPMWEIYSEEEITLDWYVNFSWYTTPWGENLVSKKITEETGVSIKFITPLGNEEEKFNALITSDTLPDIITLGWWENQVDEMISKGMVYPLNELADKYDTYFWKVSDPQVVAWYTKDDGNLYAYPNSSYLPTDYIENKNIASNQTFLVRKDIYEAIGKPDMSTTKGFKEAVEMAAKRFPMINGYPLIPVGAHVFNNTGCVSFDQYLQNFLAIPFEKDGEYYDRYTDKNYITWLKMFRELGAKGLLKEDIFIDQRTQMEEKLARGQYFCMIYQRTDMSAQQALLYANNPESIYIAIDGPKNEDGEDHILPGAGINGWTVTLISKNCEYPDRAIALFSYLMSEHGQKITYLGVEGETYDKMDGIAVIKPEVKKLINSNRSEYDRLYGADNTYWMFQDNVMQLAWKPKLEEPYGQLEEWTYPYSHYLGQYEISFDSNTEAGNIDIIIKKLWSATLPKLLLASTEERFDSIMKEFVEKREKLGFQTIIDESTRQIIETKSKLGIR